MRDASGSLTVEAAFGSFSSFKWGVGISSSGGSVNTSSSATFLRRELSSEEECEEKCLAEVGGGGRKKGLSLFFYLNWVGR